MSVAQDHYLVAWAMLHAGARWLPWLSPGLTNCPFGGFTYGQFEIDGMVYTTRLDRMGVPALTTELRTALVDRVTAARMADHA